MESDTKAVGFGGWVKCVEAVPEFTHGSLSDLVMAWMPGMDVPSPAYCQRDEYGRVAWVWRRDGQPTHWMRFPKLPE